MKLLGSEGDAIRLFSLHCNSGRLEKDYVFSIGNLEHMRRMIRKKLKPPIIRDPEVISVRR